jgi:8-oxo-dGTP diphosphatase
MLNPFERHIRITVDAIVVRKDKSIVLVRRKDEPFKDMYALPGGHVEYGETVEEAVVREVKEETGLDVRVGKLLAVYSDPDRDPRGHVVSVVFDCFETGGELVPGSDATEAWSFKKPPASLAFDHAKILKDAGY